jgi:hypothetical protein
MSETQVVKQSHRKYAMLVPLFFLLFFGLMGFYRVATNSHFASYRTIDVVQLLVSGASFGVALMVVIFWIVRPWQSSRTT